MIYYNYNQQKTKVKNIRASKSRSMLAKAIISSRTCLKKLLTVSVTGLKFVKSGTTSSSLPSKR